VGVFEQVTRPDSESTLMILSNEALDFRATLARVQVSPEGGVGLARDVALALGLHLGDTVRYVAARPI
jgi:arginine/ornithine N-succinyltransferase beta subunit